MFKQNEKAIAQIADYIPRACRGMQLQEAKARLEKKIALYIDDGCDAAVLNAAFAPALVEVNVPRVAGIRIKGE
ncbi:TPA: hypothetical protein H5076_002964 [Escherichia coli]|nr:hypothetical protein [Escherichia coli]